MKNKNKLKGFTLVELLLLTGVVSLAAIGTYIIFNQAVSWSKSNEEATQLNNAISRLNRATSASGLYTGVTKATLDGLGGIFTSNFNLTSINSPTPDKLHITYAGMNGLNCSKFVSKMLSSPGNVSAIINGTAMIGGTQISDVSERCSSDSNSVIIVLTNNISVAGLSPVVPSGPTPPPAPPAPSPSPSPVPAPVPTPSPSPSPVPSPSPSPSPAPVPVPIPSPSPSPVPSPSPSPVPSPSPAPVPTPSPPPAPAPGPTPPVNYDTGMSCTQYQRADNVFGGQVCQSYVQVLTTICPAGSVNSTWFQTIFYKSDVVMNPGPGFILDYASLPYVVGVTDNSAIFCNI